MKLPKNMATFTIWAVWCLFFGGAALWLVVGAVGYWVRLRWVPEAVSDWVQAIGSVAAIVAAFLVANRVHQMERSAVHQEGLEAEARFARLAESVAFEAACVVQIILLDAERFGSYRSRDAQLAMIEDSREAIKMLMLQPLDSRIVSSFFTIRSELADALIRLKEWGAMGPSAEELREMRRISGTLVGCRMTIDLAYRDCAQRAGVPHFQRVTV